MSETARIKITNVSAKTLEVIWRAGGAQTVLDALEKECRKTAYPGVGMAIAIAEREVANLRVDLSGQVLREVAKHGHQIAKIKSVYTTISKGKIILEIDPPDLLDFDESEADEVSP